MTIKTLAELEAEDASGFRNPEPTAADKERERERRAHRNAGAIAYTVGKSRDRCPHDEGQARAAWLSGYDNAKAQDAPEADEPEEDDEEDDGA